MKTSWSEFQQFLTFHILEFKDNDGNVTFHLDTWMILVGLFAFFASRFILKLIEWSITKRMNDGDRVKYQTIFRFINLFIYTAVMLYVMSATGMNITGILAASAALFIGIGLALQDLLKDIIAGVTILVDKSLMINDIVEIDGRVARVYEINIRTTRAITRNDKILVVPNHLFLTETIYNYTQNDTSTREEIKIGVAYGSDVELVKNTLLKCAKKHNQVLKHPAPLVLFTDFADSSLNFSLFFFIKNAFASPTIKSDLRFLINLAFEEQNITIPFPQTDVHLHKTDN